jgi:hypothetical protein
VLTGAVLCIEPETYQGSLDQPLYRDLALYIKEINRIRTELTDYIFTGDYFDDQGAEIVTDGGKTNESTGNARNLVYKVHGNHKTGKRAIVIMNDGLQTVSYTWKFTHKDVQEVQLYSPFTGIRTVKAGDSVEIDPEGMQILVER